jgi:ATP-dependent Clp protease ATP-binding subunit ClpA
MLGLLSMVKTLDLDYFRKLGPEEKRKLSSEIAAITNIIQSYGITPTVLRRHLRANISKGKSKTKQEILHRSEATKQFFKNAEAIAQKAQELNSLHLLASLIKNPNEKIGEMLYSYNISPVNIWNKIINYNPDVAHAHLDDNVSQNDLDSIHSFSRDTNTSRLTIVFDDIVGSMALFNKLGDEQFYKLIKYHDRKIRTILNRMGKGEIIKSTGDGLLMIFSDPVAAVECALMVQKEFLQEELLKIRIGMDVGEVKHVQDKKSRDIFGIKVSAASRITEAADGGHILTSKAVYDAAQKHLKNLNLEWKYLGSRNFKPGEPTIEIYEIFDTKLPMDPMNHLHTSQIPLKMPSASVSLLDEYGRDLTREAEDGKLGPFTGRRNIILQMIQTLAQAYCNNPILVGRAGVGKTTLVEALALRIVNDKDSEFLSRKKIVALNMSKIMGGLNQKTQFEERLGNVVEEAISQPDVILFIDEIHNFLGVSQNDHIMNVSHILNPLIIQGDLRFIGTTTEEEYQRFIQPDTSLERNFQKIKIDEPSRKETLEMLQIFRKQLEKFHKVWITDRALEAAIDLSIEFDPEHALPAKAIDLIDEAGAQIHIPDLSLLEGKDKQNMAVQRGGASSILNVLVIAKVLAQKTGIPSDKIIASLNET